MENDHGHRFVSLSFYPNMTSVATLCYSSYCKLWLSLIRISELLTREGLSSGIGVSCQIQTVSSLSCPSHVIFSFRFRSCMVAERLISVSKAV